MLAIQEEIALAVAAELSATFGIVDVELFPGGTQNVPAYDHYLRAQSFAQRGAVDGVPRNQAIREFEAALELDPSFGLAQVGLAQVLTAWANNDTSAARLPERRDRAVENAIRLAPELPGTSWLRSQQHLRRFEWVEAEQALQEMLGRSSANDYEANQLFGAFLVSVGRASDLELSITAYRRSLLASTALLQFAWTPIMQPVRGHPEFRELMREIRLVDLWRRTGWPKHCRPLGTNDFECD